MCLGALTAAGVDFDGLKEELGKLPVDGYALRREKIKRNGITADNIFVDLLAAEQPERHLSDIQQIIDGSDLPREVKEKSKAVFSRLAAAEAAVHDTTLESIHFHEVGAVDAIIDVVGTVMGLYLLGVDKIYASPLPMGKGFIKCMHGIIPSPAPATIEILQNVPVYGTGIEGELVTPTGAALIHTLAEDFIDLPAMKVEKTGYGSGKKAMQHPNLLRLIIGEGCSHNHKSGSLSYGHRHEHGHHVHSHVHGHDHGHVHCHADAASGPVHEHRHEHEHDAEKDTGAI